MYVEKGSRRIALFGEHIAQSVITQQPLNLRHRLSRFRWHVLSWVLIQEEFSISVLAMLTNWHMLYPGRHFREGGLQEDIWQEVKVTRLGWWTLGFMSALVVISLITVLT